MPTDRFYRLTEKKQRVIYDAAVQEFSRVPYDKASINRIIQNAKISRGSFYTYFADKMDLLRYIMSNELNGVSQVCEEAIRDTGGDYFALLERVFEYFVSESHQTAQMLNFLRNVMNHRDILQSLGFSTSPPSPIIKAAQSGNPMERLYEYIDRSDFRFDERDDYMALMTMGATTLIISVLSFYNYPDQLDLIRKNFHTSLEILKKGSLKSEKEAGGVKKV